MRISVILFGALTSKPYAFKARSWELKSIETIDLFDSLGSNIRLDVRGSEIMRILPINNEIINEEWISDKARYAFDGFKRERFINPMIKKNNIFVQATWKEAFNYITEEINKRKSNNLVINTGNFTDLEHLTSLTHFTKTIGATYNTVINNDDFINADLQEYYTIKPNILNVKGPKVFILVGINLRLENPILNIKLKRLSTNNNVLIGYIGSKNNYNLNCEHLGNNIDILKKIIKGNHHFSTVITNFLKKNLKNQKISSIFKNEVSVIFGNEIIQTQNHINILKTLKTIKNPFLNFQYNVLELYSGRINMFETGFYNHNKINNNENSIFYLLNTETLKNYKKGDFVIFQGDHNTTLRTYFDVILPTANWTEKSSLYLNCFGFLQKTQFGILPPINAREDWKITEMLVKCFEKEKTQNILTSNDRLIKIHYDLNNLSPNLMNFVNKYKIKENQKLNLEYKNNTISYFKSSNMPFKSFIFNYYQMSSVEKSSKIMNICSKDFISKKLNFSK